MPRARGRCALEVFRVGEDSLPGEQWLLPDL